MSGEEEENESLKYFLSRMDEKPEGGTEVKESAEDADMSYQAYKEKKIQEMLDEGWVLPGQGPSHGGPPARAAPLPPRKTTAPSGVFIQKLDYDTSHMWNQDLLDDDSDSDSPVPWEGTEIADKYTIGDEIGSGATSWVYAATNKETNEEVAIKVISEMTSEFIPKSQFKVHRKDTAERIKACQGNGVIPYIESHDQNDTLFIVVKKLHETLFRLLWKKTPAYNEMDASRILKSILEALSCIHKAGYAHNDVTNGNLLADKDINEVYLTGFSKATSGSVKGDLALRSRLKAPEVLGENKQHDSKVDIWNAGIVAYLMLSGKYPFATSEEVLSGELNLDGEEWSAVSDNAKSFVKSLLEIDPEKRCTAEEALEKDWITSPEGDTPLEAAQKNLGPTLFPKET